MATMMLTAPRASAQLCDCQGDANRDCVVNQLDIDIIHAHWLKSGVTREEGDVSGDGVADEVDLGIVLSRWLQVCLVNHPPLVKVGGPYIGECTGGQTRITLDGSGSKDEDGDPLTFVWSTDCPGATIDDPSSATPTITLPGPTPPQGCTITLTLSDGIGIPIPASTTVTVTDSSAPKLTLPSDVTRECGTSTASTATGVASATDACDGNPTITSTDTNATDGSGDILRTWTARDASGNATSGVQRIRVRDTAAPTLSCEPRVRVVATDAAGIASSAVSLARQISDVCDSSPAITDDRPTTLPVGETRVTTTARDSAGNVTTCTTIVEVAPPENQSEQSPPAAEPVFVEERRTITTTTAICPAFAAMAFFAAFLGRRAAASSCRRVV
ncbi:MAG: hypothetical protein U1D55_10265 [Phycisphaerae bacterium]